MCKPYGFEIEPEVREWLDNLSDSDFKRVDEVAGLLAEKGAELGGPWSDHLEGPVWELRVRLRDVAARVTYWCTPGRTIVLLTVFRKTKQHDQQRDVVHATSSSWGWMETPRCRKEARMRRRGLPGCRTGTRTGEAAVIRPRRVVATMWLAGGAVMLTHASIGLSLPQLLGAGGDPRIDRDDLRNPPV